MCSLSIATTAASFINKRTTVGRTSADPRGFSSDPRSLAVAPAPWHNARIMADYIFTLQGMTKVHPPDKKVLEEVYLSFLPGAKIGVIGFNGAGKSTLLR